MADPDVVNVRYLCAGGAQAYAIDPSGRHANAPVEVTVAFTDLENFTSYTEAEGDDAARRLLIDHHRKSGSIVRSRGGQVVKRLGDGLMLSFPAPEAAVLACLELGKTAPLPLRAGIHGGTVLLTGDDIVGRVVNLAARVTECAKGREVVVTDHVRNAVGDLRGVAFEGPYSHRFKGIEDMVPVFIASPIERLYGGST
jgi:adenylate cyclase